MFKSNLKNLREQADLTQCQAACGIGVDQKRYAKWEEGRAIPGIVVAGQIAEFYGVSLDDLIFSKQAPRLRDNFFTRYMATSGNVRKAIDVLLSKA